MRERSNDRRGGLVSKIGLSASLFMASTAVGASTAEAQSVGNQASVNNVAATPQLQYDCEEAAIHSFKFGWRQPVALKHGGFSNHYEHFGAAVESIATIDPAGTNESCVGVVDRAVYIGGLINLRNGQKGRLDTPYTRTTYGIEPKLAFTGLNAASIDRVEKLSYPVNDVCGADSVASTNEDVVITVWPTNDPTQVYGQSYTSRMVPNHCK